MDANQAVYLPSYADAYAADYRDTIVASDHVGTKGGAALISFKRPAGSYRNQATSDFALTMMQNGGFGAELDLGMGRFSVSVSPGQLFLAPPFTVTENAFDASSRGVVVALRHAYVAELLRDVAPRPETLFQELYTRPVWDDFIRVTINQLLTRSRRDTDTLFADSAISTILAALARHNRKRSVRAKRGLADWQLRRVIEKLQSMQDVSLAELAASANLSPFYFARAFKQTTGLPPHHYHLRLRMERAKDLLANTKLSLTAVALGAGYGSSQTLARVFRKEVGASPIDYRRSITT